MTQAVIDQPIETKVDQNLLRVHAEELDAQRGSRSRLMTPLTKLKSNLASRKSALQQQKETALSELESLRARIGAIDLETVSVNKDLAVIEDLL